MAWPIASGPNLARMLSLITSAVSRFSRSWSRLKEQRRAHDCIQVAKASTRPV